MEAELFIKVGAWKSIEELEDSISLPELDTFLKAIREDQKETRVFQAAMQGIDLTKDFDNPVEERKREIERRAAAKLAGGMEAVERQEFAEFGISFEVADD